MSHTVIVEAKSKMNDFMELLYVVYKPGYRLSVSMFLSVDDRISGSPGRLVSDAGIARLCARLRSSCQLAASPRRITHPIHYEFTNVNSSQLLRSSWSRNLFQAPVGGSENYTFPGPNVVRVLNFSTIRQHKPFGSWLFISFINGILISTMICKMYWM